MKFAFTRHLSLLLAAFTLWAAVPYAQEEPAPTTSVGQTIDADSPLDLSSPRNLVSTFYDAMNQVAVGNRNYLDRALSCLYLEDIPEGTRPRDGERHAKNLFQLLDDTVYRLEDIPDAHGEENYTFHLDLPAGGVDLRLHRYEDGLWRFSSEAIEQIETLAQEVPEEAEPAETSPGAPKFDPQFASPRATMRVFLTAFSNQDFDLAVSAVDLSGVDTEVRTWLGIKSAVLIKRVLDRYERIDFSDLPNTSTGESLAVLTTRAGQIELVPVTDEETGITAWKFSSDTVKNIVGLYDAYKHLPVVDGVIDNTPRLYSIAARDWAGEHLPFLLERTVVVENYQWVLLLLVILCGMTISRIGGWILGALVRRRLARGDVEVEPTHISRHVVRPLRIALMSWVWLLGLTMVDLPIDWLGYLATGARLVTWAAVFWAMYMLVDLFTRYITQHAANTANRYDDILVAIVSRSLKIFVMVCSLLIILDIVGFDYKSVLAGLGLGGLAFALAAKDTVSNFFGSLTVALDRPFHIGDWIAMNGAEGIVEQVGIRSTRIRTFYNSLIYVPNANLINANIDNFGQRQYRRIKTTLAVTYSTPPDKLEAFCEGIRELIRQHPYTRKDYFHVYFNEFGASSLDILLYCFVEVPDWGTELRERERLLLDIVRLAHTLGVEFAFPTQTLFLHGEEPGGPPADGDTRAKAFEEGRQLATRLARQSLGRPGRVPPPVHFESADGIESDLSDTQDR